jgi:Dihydroprymidine dehydrogenase domain II, 4Fe-4S cluster
MRKPFAITLDVGSSRANHTGAWRTERPVYVHNLPLCNSACPAGENIQQWLYDAEEGSAKYEAAWRQIMQDNPFPAVMGRGLLPALRDRMQPGRAGLGGRYQLGGAIPRRQGAPQGLAGSGRRGADG